jgi:hypothetical protein
MWNYFSENLNIWKVGDDLEFDWDLIVLLCGIFYGLFIWLLNCSLFVGIQRLWAVYFSPLLHLLVKISFFMEILKLIFFGSFFVSIVAL